MPLEKGLETWLSQWVKKKKGKYIKLPSMFAKGIPDRMLILPHNGIYFIELKTDSEASPLQVHWVKWLKEAGFNAEIIKGKDELKEYLKGIENGSD